MQHHAANELDVEMALAERALARLADSRESRHQEVVELGPFGELFPEFIGAGA